MNDVSILAEVKRLLGLRHLVGIKPGTTRDSPDWIEQELWPLPARLQYDFLELAAQRMKRTAGRPLEQLGTPDLLANLREILERGRAA